MKLMHLVTRLYDLGDSLMWALALLSVPFWLYVVVCVAPTARMIARQQHQNAIWHADHFFCQNHGMLAGTRAYAQCVRDLAEFRAREDQRILFADSLF